MKTKPYIIALCLGAVLQATGFAQLPDKPKAPPVGVPRDAKLFNGKWYKVVFEKVSWQSARDKCRSSGGQLVVIPDEPTWAFVKGLTPANVWLGATDEKVEGVWVSIDGTPMSFFDWCQWQPDNAGGKENYLIIWKGQMNDAPNSEPSATGYICEWKDK